MLRPRDIDGAVVVVTGASSGIGRATALAFAGHRCRVVLAARGADALREVAEACEALGAEALVVPTDVADAAAVEHLRRQAVERFAAIDVWVEAAALLAAGPVEATPPDEVRRVVETNVLGTLHGARQALVAFEAQGHGVLVLVASMLGLVPTPAAPVYVATKYGIRGLGLSLRQAVAGRPDIHVSTVLPGPVDTPMFDRASNHTGRRLRAVPPAAAPERVAATIVSCARRPRRQATTGVVPHAILVAHRLVPRLTEWLVGQWSIATITGGSPAPDTSGALFGAPDRGEVDGGWRRGRLRRRIGAWIGAVQAGRAG
jgi:NADP-dependent 3-hydroxy acid dehydrogenase YdfG